MRALKRPAQKGKEALEALAESLDMQVETIFAEGPTGKEIVRVAAEHHADLLILGTHGYTGWNHLTIGKYRGICCQARSLPGSYRQAPRPQRETGSGE